MKTKMLSRCTACALALVLFFAALAPTVFADSTNHKGNDSLLNGSNYIVSYSMNGKAVVEQLTIHDEGTTRITRKGRRPDLHLWCWSSVRSRVSEHPFHCGCTPWGYSAYSWKS